MTDESLMARVSDGDHWAFSVLVDRYTRMFFSAAYRICGEYEAAEDVVQDAFLKLWDRPDIWNKARGAKFTTWFYRVVTNQAIDHMRKIKKNAGSDTLERITDERADQHEEMEMTQQQILLERAIQSLPERQKLALTLCVYEGLSQKEAAEIIGVGLKGLESLISRAKAGIKDVLKRDGILMDEEGKEDRYG